MKTEELKAYQDFERHLRDYPVKRFLFYACEHLGIEFREEDFAVDEVAEAKAFVSQFPDMD